MRAEPDLPPEMRPLGRSRRWGYEILPALNAGPHWWIYCRHNDRWHSHGAGPGHRVPHCHCPIHDKGYSLRYGGELRDLLDKLPAAHRRRLPDKRQIKEDEIWWLKKTGQLPRLVVGGPTIEERFEADRATQLAIDRAQWAAEEAQYDELEGSTSTRVA
jgi:hypothetical protein